MCALKTELANILQIEIDDAIWESFYKEISQIQVYPSRIRLVEVFIPIRRTIQNFIWTNYAYTIP